MYQVLYRKWRPKVFSDVVGQPHITRTLLSEVRENRLAHAYLFTGSRGTGKTTCAKILSKAINCLNPQNGNPCNVCEICRGADDGTLLDIVEIDAASNRGIDDIRMLRDESNFTPAQATYRVYIIDEVHMLTIEAFNALLKTLEEPPEHVKFILATTEVHKLPSTILSRCQRFDFRRIEPKVIADRLMYVAREENAVLHEDAAMLIARIADGGMRDALSLLDSAISVSAEVTAAVVSDCAGLMGRDAIYDLVRAIAAGDTAACLSILDALHNASCDTERLISELTNQFRNFLIFKTVQRPENLIVCTQDELQLLAGMASLFTTEQTLFALNVLTKTADAIKRTANRRIEAEMALIRLCSPETDADVSALMARIAKLESELKAIRANGVPVANINDPPAPAPRETAPAPVPTSLQQAPAAQDRPQQAPAAQDPPQPAPAIDPEEDIPPFEGFGQETPSGGYAAAFSGEEEDDAAFDFDAFMAEYDKQTGAAPPDAAPPEPEPTAAAEPAPESVPETAPSPAPAAPAEKKHIYSPNVVGTLPDGPVNKGAWVNVVQETERSFGPLRGMLTGSTARILGDVLVVTLTKPVFLEDPLIIEKLQPVVEKNLHRHYEIRLEK